MKCVNPPEVAEVKLAAFLEGEADEDVAGHLETCPYCSARAQQLAGDQAHLLASLYRSTCPSSWELGEYHLRALAENRMQTIARHVTECPHCRAEVRQLQAYLHELAPMTDVPAMDPLARTRILIARLLGNGDPLDGAAPAWAGVRGAVQGPRLYQVDGVQITIEIQDDAGRPHRKVLLGLIIGMPLQDVAAELWQDEQLIETIPVEESGNFVVPNLVPGAYELIVSGPELEVHIQDVQVEA